jgi:uncharacterized protein (DUF433 family)
MMDTSVLDRIEINPDVMLDKPVIRGTRIPVELVLRKLGEGATEDDLLDAYPRLTKEDIRAALSYGDDLGVRVITTEAPSQERVEAILQRAKLRAAALSDQVTVDEAWMVRDSYAIKSYGTCEVVDSKQESHFQTWECPRRRWYLARRF